jgi:hypothetical protein
VQAAKAFDLHVIASGQLSFTEQELLAFAHGPWGLPSAAEWHRRMPDVQWDAFSIHLFERVMCWPRYG